MSSRRLFIAGSGSLLAAAGCSSGSSLLTPTSSSGGLSTIRSGGSPLTGVADASKVLKPMTKAQLATARLAMPHRLAPASATVADAKLSALMDTVGVGSFISNGVHFVSLSLPIAALGTPEILPCGDCGGGDGGGDDDDGEEGWSDDGSMIIGFVQYQRQTIYSGYDTTYDPSGYSGGWITGPTYYPNPQPNKPSANFLAQAAAAAAAAAASFASTIRSNPGAFSAIIRNAVAEFEGGLLPPMAFLGIVGAIAASPEFLALLAASAAGIGAYLVWKACFSGA